MFGLNIPFPDFWIAYFFIFWILVGGSATPVTFRHKGYPVVLGVMLATAVGLLLYFKRKFWF